MATIGHVVLPVIAWLQLKLDLRSLAAMLFFALLPDIDIIASFILTGSPYTLHRGITHSVAFALIPLLLFAVARKDFLLWGFFGALTHPLIDLLDARGVPLLWPLSSQQFSLNLWPYSFISDIPLLAILIIYLIYYFGSRWYGDSVKQGRGRAAKKGRH